MVSLIAAQTRNRVIGAHGELPWHQLKADMSRFRTLTKGHPVVMGRKTWESLPEQFRPLPGRTNVVVTRNGDYTAEGATVATSIQEAVTYASSQEGSEEVFVIGGAEVYSQSLALADRIYLTVVDTEGSGDALFPVVRDQPEWNEEVEGTFSADAENEYSGTFYRLDRKPTHA